MKEYRVRFTGENGRNSYQEFPTIEQARELYESLNGEAVIQKFDQGTATYISQTWMILRFPCRNACVAGKIMKRKSRGGERDASTERHHDA